MSMKLIVLAIFASLPGNTAGLPDLTNLLVQPTVNMVGDHSTGHKYLNLKNENGHSWVVGSKLEIFGSIDGNTLAPGESSPTRRTLFCGFTNPEWTYPAMDVENHGYAYCVNLPVGYTGPFHVKADFMNAANNLLFFAISPESELRMTSLNVIYQIEPGESILSSPVGSFGQSTTGCTTCSTSGRSGEGFSLTQTDVGTNHEYFNLDPYNCTTFFPHCFKSQTDYVIDGYIDSASGVVTIGGFSANPGSLSYATPGLFTTGLTIDPSFTGYFRVVSTFINLSNNVMFFHTNGNQGDSITISRLRLYPKGNEPSAYKPGELNIEAGGTVTITPDGELTIDGLQ